MRKVLAVWFCLLFLLVPSMVLAGEKVVVEEKEVENQPLRFISDLKLPPFAFVENFKNVGFEIDLGEALGKELGRPVKWIKQNFNISAFSSALEVGRADAVFCRLTVTEKRKQYFNFSIPYFRTSLAVAAPRNVDWDKQAFKNGLTSKIRVGVLRRTTGEEWARKNLKVTRKAYATPERLARSLKNREVGIILIDKPILIWTMANRHYKFKIVEEGLDHQDYAIAVSKSN